MLEEAGTLANNYNDHRRKFAIGANGYLATGGTVPARSQMYNDSYNKLNKAPFTVDNVRQYLCDEYPTTYDGFKDFLLMVSLCQQAAAAVIAAADESGDDDDDDANDEISNGTVLSAYGYDYDEESDFYGGFDEESEDSSDEESEDSSDEESEDSSDEASGEATSETAIARDCVVCFSLFIENMPFVCSRCRNSCICSPCLVKWNKDCPTCRAPIPSCTIKRLRRSMGAQAHA